MSTDHSHQPRFRWKTLERPFSVLAPMEYVTDSAFRRLVRFCGAPDVMVSEFTHVEKINAAHQINVHKRLMYHPEEHPLIAQIWGNSPDHTFTAVKRLTELGFDGIDLNMGCPAPRAMQEGGCAALIKNPSLAGDLFHAASEAANGRVPVSIKTRLGFDQTITEPWTQCLLDLRPDALTIHGRVATDMYQGNANWDEIGKVVTLRDAMASDTIIIGNGDVRLYEEIQEKHRQYGVDGVMVGRAVLKNPLFFQNDGRSLGSLSPPQRVQLLWHHAILCRDSIGDTLGFPAIKKYLKTYISHFPKAAALRDKFSMTRSFEEAHALLKPFLIKDTDEA